jgi:uncharacterized protein Yka (UPF0111/DUF47 family)
LLIGLRRRRDPIKLLERQAGLAIVAADLLHKLVHEVAQARTRAQALSAVAHDGHDLTRDLVHGRRGLWRAPLDRQELDALARGVDAVLDAIRAAADAVVAEGREATAAGRALADVIPKSVAAMRQAIHVLPGDGARLQDHLVEIRRLEHLADALLLDAVGSLRQEQADGLTVLRWMEIYERLERVTNRCETVAGIVERIATRRN